MKVNKKFKNLCFSGAGFTLIEILIVTLIIGILSAMLFFNFRSPQSNITARNQTVATLVSDIRRAQTMAITSTLYQGNIMCGYGVHYVGGNNNYKIYARQRPACGCLINAATGCAGTGNKNYGQGLSADSDVQNIYLANPNFQIKSSYCPNGGSDLDFTAANRDIFFEPPDPKTYLYNNAPPYNKDILITVVTKPESNCNVPYATIKIHSSGAMETCSSTGGGICTVY